MKCPRCQHENRSGAKFCEEWATPLARTYIKTTLIYAHLSPAHLRNEVAKTERRTEPAVTSAQGSAQEAAELEDVSRK